MSVDMAAVRKAWEGSQARARDLIAGIDSGALDRPTDTPGWTVRNLAAHITEGDDVILLTARPLSTGRNLLLVPFPAVIGRKLGDLRNARTVRKFRTAQPVQLLKVMDQKHRNATSALDAVPPEGWNRAGNVPGLWRLTLAQVVQLAADHYEEHCATLRKATGASTA